MFVRSRVFYATKKLINRKIECLMLFIIGCTFLLMIWHKAPSLTVRLRVSILSWISKDGRNKKMRWGGGGSFMQDLYEKVCKNARPVLELHLRLFERCARTDRLVANCQHLYLPVLTSPPHCTQLSPGSLSPRSAIPAGWILKYWSFSPSSGNFDIQCRHFRWPLPCCPDHYSYLTENWIHLKG